LNKLKVQECTKELVQGKHWIGLNFNPDEDMDDAKSGRSGYPIIWVMKTVNTIAVYI
jgi:hypothetical protein